ncbi:MAG: pilus assembly FimT family protein [Minisyncoccota bacterium]
MKKGFTMIETLVVVAVVMLILGVVTTPFFDLNERQALLKETSNVASVLNHARSMTLSSKGGVQHGVHLESDRVVLFQGPTYNSASSDNVSLPLNSLVNISNISLATGLNDVIFEELTGTTASYGNVTISLNASSTQSRIITITSTGIVNVSQ